MQIRNESRKKGTEMQAVPPPPSPPVEDNVFVKDFPEVGMSSIVVTVLINYVVICIS